MKPPSKRTIQRRKKELRKLIETAGTDDTLKSVAYAIETAITWATEETVGWESPAVMAVDMANIIKRDIARTIGAIVQKAFNEADGKR